MLFRPAAAIFMALAAPCPASAWDFNIVEGDSAGEVTACISTQRYKNAWFTVRVYAERMDFLYHRNDFTLPYDTQLGVVAMVFPDSESTYMLLANTLPRTSDDSMPTASTIYFDAKKSDYSGIFSSLKNEAEMGLVFPNGDIYSFDLDGSARALNVVSECWKRIPTGPVSNNPFEMPPANNPFDTPAQSAPDPDPAPPAPSIGDDVAA